MVFNEEKIINNRNKAGQNFSNYDFLLCEVSARLAERLDFIKGSFNNSLIIGCSQGASSNNFAKHEKLHNYTCVDNAKNMLKTGKNYTLCTQSNYFANIKPQSLDLIVSSMFFHTVNDIKTLLQNCYNHLKKDGAILFNVPTIGTLKELEDAFLKADLEVNNSFVARVHPFLELKQTANLLQDIGFKDISSDRDIIEVMYKDTASLFKDLKGMGARSALPLHNNLPITKKTLNIVNQEFESKKEEENNHFKITVEFCNFIAWK